jgi:hypothetical protein
MLFFDGGAALLFFALWLFCLIDVITTPEHECRNLPKLVWLLLVVLLLDIGSIAWLVAGRNWGRPVIPAAAMPRTAPAAPAARTSSPDDDEEFLAGLRARAEEQRRRAREAQEAQEAPKTQDDPPPAGT